MLKHKIILQSFLLALMIHKILTFGFRISTKTRFTGSIRVAPKDEKGLNSHGPTQTHTNLDKPRQKNLFV